MIGEDKTLRTIIDKVERLTTARNLIMEVDETVDLSPGSTKDIYDAYKKYLVAHVDNVQRSYLWLKKFTPEIFNDLDDRQLIKIEYLIETHDRSKYSKGEYGAYAKYFYGARTEDVKIAFNYAWNRHIHKNYHHWQYWVLQNDDGSVKALEIPIEYRIEMLCDWMSFGMKQKRLYELIEFYDKKKEVMILGKKTRKGLEKDLARIYSKIKEPTHQEELEEFLKNAVNK